MKKLIRVTTVPSSLRSLLRGQHRFMSSHYEVIGIASPGDALSEVKQNEGISTYAVSMTRLITPLKDLVATYKLYKIFKNEKPDIVHTHTPKAGTLGMLAARLAGVPIRIHDVAGLPLLEEKGGKRRLLDAVESATYACATHVLPNSKGLHQIILKNKYTKPEKLQVIGNGSSNGVNTIHYDPNLISEATKSELRAELNIKNNEIVFIYIGRIVKDKGINELIHAFDMLSQAYKNCKLILLGGIANQLDPLMPETESLLHKHPQIHYLGIQREIRPFLGISDALVFPSYREGFPNVVLESSAMGLPCIVSNINGCNEIIEHGVNGLIVPAKEEKALFEAMKDFIEHPEKLKSMAKNARPRIIERYQQSYVWDEMLKFYKNIEL